MKKKRLTYIFIYVCVCVSWKFWNVVLEKDWEDMSSTDRVENEV